MLEPILLPATRRSARPCLWFGIDIDAHIAHEHIEIPEYQLYAVEKWIVDRSRPIDLLLVYTGDPSHRITVASFAPHTDADYEKAIHHLRRDGARPKRTDHGVLMVTSLAHFRSDYTIVKIPNGDFLAVRDQLYANINLLRMGCSGRSALSLDEPSEPTKERFLSAYHLHFTFANVKSSEHLPLAPSSSPSTKNIKKEKDRALFTATVLELVKLIQAGLALFAHYGSLSPPTPSVLLDGLLCDKTVDGMHRWIAEVGEPFLGLEPTERVADPNFVSALLSMVLAIRNKLAALVSSSASNSAYQLTPVPKDPFVYPYAFSLSLMSFLQHASTMASSTSAPAVFHITQVAPFVVSSYSPPAQSFASTASGLPIGAVLSLEILEHIDNFYDKSKSSDHRRVRRVFKGKRDDVARGTAVDSDGEESHSHSHFHSSASRDKRGALSDSDAPHLHLLGGSPANSIGSSAGNRVLGGIGTLLLPSTSLSTSASGSGGAGSITEPITNLSTFLSIALSKESSSSGFSSGKRGANLKRIRGSVGGGITMVSGAAPSDHSMRAGVGKTLAVGIATGKSKRQRESVDMGYFYSSNAAGMALGTVVGGPSLSGTNVEGAPLTPGAAEKDREMGKEQVVGGSIKALWGGRVMELVKMREWCEELAQNHQIGDSALIPPSSNYLLGNTASQRATGGSAVGPQQSAASGVKEKVKRLKDRGKEKEKLKLPSGPLLTAHSDAELKSDTGRSTEGEDSESVYPSASNTPLIHPEALNTSNPMASASFGSLLGGRVRDKLGNWANLTKRKGQSVDFSASLPQLQLNTENSLSTSAGNSPVATRQSMGYRRGPQDGDDRKRPLPQHRGASAPLLTLKLATLSKRHPIGTSVGPPVSQIRPRMMAKSTSNTSSGPQSPTLPPMVYPGDLTGAVQSDDDLDQDPEILSSGQISPLSDHNKPSSFIAPRSLGQQPRNFSLAVPPSQQDRNYLSVSTINEKLSHLSNQMNADASSAIPSARSSNTNLQLPLSNTNINPKRKKFLYSANSTSNINTGELTGNEDGMAEEWREGLRRPRLGDARSMSSTGMPRITSWSDPLSARYIIGGVPVTSHHIDPLDLGGRSDYDDMGGRSEEGEGDLDRAGRSSRGGGGGGVDIDSEGDFVSDSFISKPLRPSLRTRRSEFANPRHEGNDIGGNDSSKERREKARFHSLLSVVDRDGSFFLDDPVGSWDQPLGLYSYDADEIDGAHPCDWGMDEGYFGAGVGVDLDDKEWVQKRRGWKGGKLWHDPLRRRSFHDLDDFYDMPVLSAERMRVDVEVCGQVLVMLRREEHLRNVVACLEILNNSLSSANGLLRQEYETHLTSLSQLGSRTKVLADLDLQSVRTDNLSQQANILRYEAEQFNVPLLYHSASLSRQNVLEMRHKVFGVHKVFDASEPGLADKGKGAGEKKRKGTGSRRVLPEGVRGAHGKFNRLQKRLDGEEVVVDWLGRTESEVEEEEQLGRNGHFSDARYDSQTGVVFDSEDENHEQLDGLGALAKEGGEGEGEHVVEHSSIRPMWLLRFFMGWGARWSARAATAVQAGPMANQLDKDGPGQQRQDIDGLPEEGIVFDGKESRKGR